LQIKEQEKMIDLERNKNEALSKAKVNAELMLDELKNKFNKVFIEKDHEIANLRIDHENITNQNKYFKEEMHDREARIQAFEEEQDNWAHELEVTHHKLENEQRMRQLTEQNNIKLKNELSNVLETFEDSSKERILQDLAETREKLSNLNRLYQSKLVDYDIIQSQLKFKELDLKRKTDDFDNQMNSINQECE